jgi:hypothetical protein
MSVRFGFTRAGLALSALLGMMWITAAWASTQTLAAGQAQTNLQTESVWPGAQDPPYICCWDQQGQYVTFSFTVDAGSTSFTLRYSAGNGPITRTIELDGLTWVANQTFPGTPNWSTWATLTLTQTLTAGAHTLTIVFDATSGSKGFLNLDNLTIVQSSTTTSQTLAAGKAATNLRTESLYPGAQDPPYICCWNAQGQYVTFSFNVSAGPTTLTLRYSAGAGASTRKIQLDGATLIADQVFLGTPNWSTWATLTLTQSLSAGAHTLTLLFDTASGSANYLNLDTLTIVQGVNGGSQTLAAGKAQTNLRTESVYPGAQDPPYICCWSQQGQYVTFSFTVPGGPTEMVLRYSAGATGITTRNLQVDGTVLVGKQVFPSTGNWSTWSTLGIEQSFSAGAHTLTILFDSPSGSADYLNLDNLQLTYGASTTPPPPGVTVALGYADSASGLTPWSGSSNTVFIGEGPQCCATHGPDNGSPGYDGGAIEITNSGTTSVTVNNVSVDFGGGSSPSSFALWTRPTAPSLPQTLTPGEHLVLTMTSSFNFDTSDLFGEACHINSGVVPVVHVTVNGVVTDYMDDHQILNSDGADLASCPGDISEQVPFTGVVPGAQPAAVPVNDVTPSITGVPTQAHVLSGFAGGWNASPPPSIALQWSRCNSSGASCTAISGQTTPTYIPTAADVGSTIRLLVTATNASGKVSLYSAPSAPIASGPAIAQMGDTSTGFTSVYVTSTTELSSVFTAPSSGKTIDFEFFARGAGGTQVFTPRIYSATNGVKGTLLGTGAAITVPMGTNGQWYVSTLSGVSVTAGAQYVLALEPSGTKSTYVGAETNGQMSFFVDYQP